MSGWAQVIVGMVSFLAGAAKINHDHTNPSGWAMLLMGIVAVIDGVVRSAL